MLKGEKRKIILATIINAVSLSRACTFIKNNLVIVLFLKVLSVDIFKFK